MKLLPLNNNTLALIVAGAITITFFVAGYLEALDHLLIKIICLTGFFVLFVFAFMTGLKNSIRNRSKKNS